MTIKIDQEMQKYFNFNIDSYQKILDSSGSSLMRKFEAEIAIATYKHAQQRLTHLQYDVAKEVSQ